MRYLATFLALAACGGSHLPTHSPTHDYGYAYVESTRFPLPASGQVSLDHPRLEALGASCTAARMGDDVTLSCVYRGARDSVVDRCGDGRTRTLTVGAVTVGVNCEN